jgi:uncharacterized heparinase superfamily protein
LARELRAQADGFLAPRRRRTFDERALLVATRAASLDELWLRLGRGPFPAQTAAIDETEYRRLCPGDGERLFSSAERALAHRVDLLGSGPVELGPRIDWHRDHKTGFAWPRACRSSVVLAGADLGSDVKFPWELSRLQWLIPAGQAFLLSGEERYAEGVRDVLEDWIEQNPYGEGVNWACPMEAALRILSWTWFFHVFRRSPSWQERAFRDRLVRALYLHGEFTAGHLERSDVNGNHLTADAAGLVFAGSFFEGAPAARRWERAGWRLLERELKRQVLPDGVDFEASIAYHRLVMELFLLPALYRRACGREVSAGYWERLAEMGRFVAAYSRPDGSVPLWGDADDGRALPLGGQDVNDHRYLSGLVGSACDRPELREGFSGPRSEVFWLLGGETAARLPDRPLGAESGNRLQISAAFPHGGFYVMRNPADHVFIDCGPVGMRGRGGHGHNDCLAFEALLDGVALISDCGAYVYTPSFRERNLFRSTACHNTPRVDGEEINRFVRWDDLWSLHDDARPDVRLWQTSRTRDLFRGAHSGYRRLSAPVTPVRAVALDHARHLLAVQDAFEGGGEHRFEVPLHLSAGVEPSERGPGEVSLHAKGREFRLVWGPAEAWHLSIASARISPRYGVLMPTVRLAWWREGSVDPGLLVCLAPAGLAGRDLLSSGRRLLST